MINILDKFKLLKRYNSISFRITLLIISIVLLISLFAGVYVYTSLYKILADNTVKELNQLLQQVNINVESQLSTVDMTSKMILTNPVIKKDLNLDPGIDPYENFLVKQNIQDQMDYISSYNLPWGSRLLRSVFLFDDKRHYYYLFQKFYYTEEYEQQTIDQNLQIYDKTITDIFDIKIIPPVPTDPTIYFIRNINDLNSMKFRGKIIMGLDEEKLAQIYQTISKYKEFAFYLVDDQGTIFSNADKSQLGRKINANFAKFINYSGTMDMQMNGKKYLGAANVFSGYNLTSIIVIPKNEIFSKLSSSIFSYIYVILIIMLVFALGSSFFSSKTTKPLKEMIKHIQHIVAGNFKTKMPHYKYSELNDLSKAFNRMTGRIENLISEVYEKQLLLKESELKSLHAQINPHFIFNILETVSWEARMSGMHSVDETINHLGKLIRATISMGRKEKVTIREELQYIESYLYLQKKRFEDRLQTYIKIYDDSVLDCYIPRLCIQVIVENAIIHGLERKTGKGTLTLEMSKENNIILIEISDDGIGFNTDEINLEHSNLDIRGKSMHASIGLYNSNRRIKLMYGEEYGISIYSKINSGTNVSVKIPADQAGDANV